MNIIYGLISFSVGMSSTVQSGLNGQLLLATGNAMFASLINFLGGAIVMAALLLAAAGPRFHALPPRERLAETRWWMWCGGPAGVIYVAGTIVFPPLIGFAAFFSMAIAGQLIASVLVDCFGWMGNRVRKPDRIRAAGVILLIAGAIIVQHT